MTAKRMKRALIVGTTVAVLAISSVMALGAGNGWWKAPVAEPVQQSLLPSEVEEAVLEALVWRRR